MPDAEVERYDSDEVEEAVLEGEIVDETPRPLPLQVIHVVQLAARHEHTRTAGRHLAYIPAGAVVVTKRLWESRTSARYERWLRMAEATGSHEQALEWESRLAEFREDRHSRRMDLIETPLKILLQLPKLGLGLFGLLAAMGVLLAIATKHVREVEVPFQVAADIFRWTAIAVGVSYGPFLLALPWFAVAMLWQVGRTAGNSGPSWARTSADGDTDVDIDERLVSQALEAMRIPQIRDYLKQGLPLQFIVPCRQEGRGTYCEVRLPKVPAEKIVRRRTDFAAGLYRLPKEVWPSIGSEAAILKAWIADKGALNDGAGPYPLLEEGVTDVFKGVPFGRSLRGDPVDIPVMERNSLTGGMPGQGKSGSARVTAAGYALDPTAELRIWIPDTNFDFEAFRPRCSRYVMGAEEEHIRQIRDDLIELKAEVQARGQLLIDYEVPAVTRELASAGVGLHPLFCLLEEAHVAITHAEFGKEISGLLVDIVRLGRKRGIHVLVSTQAPTKDSMPRDVTRNCSNGIAFAVGDHVANDALLGQGAYRGGHRATELIPGTDRGTALCKGFSGERSEMVQVYFLDVSHGHDQVTPIIARSLAEIARLGRGVPGAGHRPAIEARDLLVDLDEVMGDERVKLTDVAALLRELAPSWAPYRSLTGTGLRDRLRKEGVRVITTGGTLRLDPSDLRTVIARRAEGE